MSSHLAAFSLGTLGGGGSTLTVPIFGALSHWRHGNVQWRTAFIFGAVAMLRRLGRPICWRHVSPEPASGEETLTFSAYLGYAGKVDMRWGFVAGFTAVAVLGIVVGTRLVQAATPAQLKRAFAIFLLVVGAFVFYQNRAVFHRAEVAGGVERTR